MAGTEAVRAAGTEAKWEENWAVAVAAAMAARRVATSAESRADGTVAVVLEMAGLLVAALAV